MALPLPPASHLHAVLLVTKSRSLGPRLVFHYPPLSPSAAALGAAKDPTWFRHETSTASADSRSSDSDWDSSAASDDDNDAELGSRTSGGRGSARTATNASSRERARRDAGLWGRHEAMADEPDAPGSDCDDPAGGGDGDWHTVLGFAPDALEKMLSPDRAAHPRRFELGVESLVFVGAPMFARADGRWNRSRRRTHKPASSPPAASPTASPAASSPAPPPTPAIHPPGFEPGYGHSPPSTPARSEAGSDTRSDVSSLDAASPDMTMFNVVLVLHPPALEYQPRVRAAYDHVARKYAKALRHEQARCQFVWREAKRILAMKQRAQEHREALPAAWHSIVARSPLARSMAVLFDAIAHDKIAHIHLDAACDTSLQIPQPDSIPYLPSALEPQRPGLWLTTSNVMLEDDDDAPMTQHATLLLLEDAETLIKDLGGDAGGSAAAIAFYIRHIVPTKSLLKICKKHNILAHDMEYIASHLVYWRRARLIAPLSPQDTYIVSPNADMAALPAAVALYAQRFPTLPTLPKVLSMLSGTPRPFRTFIPTAEHREPYMEILAWLMRGGWVTQLRTFAWVRVTPDIKVQVAIEMEREERRKKADEARKELAGDSDSVTDSLLSDKRSSLFSVGSARSATPLRRIRRERDTNTHADEETDGGTTLSPQLTASAMAATAQYRGTAVRTASDAGSASSQRTTIGPHPTQRPESPSHLGVREARPFRPSPLHLKPTSPSRASIVSPTSPETPYTPPTAKDFTASTILCPQKASSLEARWIDKIAESFDNTALFSANPSPLKNTEIVTGVTGKELKESWGMLLRHLDGKHAIEDVAAREGIKRKRVAALFNAVKEKGWLVVTRHW